MESIIEFLDTAITIAEVIIFPTIWILFIFIFICITRYMLLFKRNTDARHAMGVQLQGNECLIKDVVKPKYNKRIGMENTVIGVRHAVICDDYWKKRRNLLSSQDTTGFLGKHEEKTNVTYGNITVKGDNEQTAWKKSIEEETNITDTINKNKIKIEELNLTEVYELFCANVEHTSEKQLQKWYTYFEENNINGLTLSGMDAGKLIQDLELNKGQICEFEIFQAKMQIKLQSSSDNPRVNISSEISGMFELFHFKTNTDVYKLMEEVVLKKIPNGETILYDAAESSIDDKDDTSKYEKLALSLYQAGIHWKEFGEWLREEYNKHNARISEVGI